jgi:DNA-binding MarR family transcriptional regulator
VPGETDDSLTDAFWAVAGALRRRSLETLAPLDITPSQSRALSVLMRHDVIRLSELSDHLRIAARSTTEVVDGLQDRGLIERRPDPHDRRATLIALTDVGRQLGEAIRAARAEDAAAYFSALSASDRANLARILGKLRA